MSKQVDICCIDIWWGAIELDLLCIYNLWSWLYDTGIGSRKQCDKQESLYREYHDLGVLVFILKEFFFCFIPVKLPCNHFFRWPSFPVIMLHYSSRTAGSQNHSLYVIHVIFVHFKRFSGQNFLTLMSIDHKLSIEITDSKLSKEENSFY